MFGIVAYGSKADLWRMSASGAKPPFKKRVCGLFPGQLSLSFLRPPSIRSAIVGELPQGDLALNLCIELVL
jgi:hypothetical protein